MWNLLTHYLVVLYGLMNSVGTYAHTAVTVMTSRLLLLYSVAGWESIPAGQWTVVLDETNYTTIEPLHRLKFLNDISIRLFVP